MCSRNTKVWLITSFLTIIILSSEALIAQGLRLPNEDGSDLAREKCLFCKPGVVRKSKSKGVEIAWTPSLSRNVVPVDARKVNNSRLNRLDEFKFKFKIPIVNAESFKALLGFEHGWDIFRFDLIGSAQSDFFFQLDGQKLKYNKFSAYFTKSFNHKYYAVMRVRASFNGDYENFVNIDRRYSNYSAMGVFGVKPHEELEYGFGLSYSNGFNRVRILPFAVYNRTFNEKWGIETLIPVQFFARYNADPQTILLFGAEYTSRRYSIDIYDALRELNDEVYLRNAGINVVGSLERKLFSWVWLNAKAGYHLPFNTQIEGISNPNDSFNYRQGAFPFFKLSIFVTPDKAFIK